MATLGKIHWVSIGLCIGWGLACSEAASDSAGANARAPVNVMSRADAMCGPNCLWQVAKAYGKERSLKEIATSAGTDSLHGTTVEGMVRACHAIGLPAEAVKAGMERVVADPRVAVLLLNTGKLAHYVILDKVEENRVRLLDGAEFRELPASRLRENWTGVAILIGDPPERAATRLGGILRLIGVALVLCAMAYWGLTRRVLIVHYC